LQVGSAAHTVVEVTTEALPCTRQFGYQRRGECDTVRELPLNVGVWTDLAAFAAWIRYNPDATTFAVGAGSCNRGFGQQLTISGARRSRKLPLDGVSLNDYANGAPVASLAEIGRGRHSGILSSTRQLFGGVRQTSGGVFNASPVGHQCIFMAAPTEFLRNTPWSTGILRGPHRSEGALQTRTSWRLSWRANHQGTGHSSC